METLVPDRDLRRIALGLAADRKRLVAVLDALEDAVLAVDAQGRLVLANPMARALLELDDDALSAPLLNRVRLPALHESLRDALRGARIDVDCDHPGPPRRRLHLRAAPMPGGGAIAVLADITRLERLERVRRDFVANVSHELRTPVTIIKASAETLLDGAIDDPEAARQFTDAVLRNADRLAALVGDLLDLARIESGRQVLARSALPLARVMDDAVKTLETAASSANVRIVNEIDPEIVVHADARASEQVVVNLVQNALQHSPRGAQVVLSALAGGDTVRIEVRDSGVGVPVELRSRLFERFFRVDPARVRIAGAPALGGTGLGLAIARHLVAAMGGTIGVEDPPSGQGSVFFFTLPRHQSVLTVALPDVPEAPDGGVDDDLALLDLDVVDETDEPPASNEARILGLRPEVQELRRQLLRMAGRVEEMIGSAVRAVVLRDDELASRTIASDRAVNQDELEADSLCMRLLGEGPQDAIELRFVSRSMKMITDLERIADLAVNISERVPRLGVAGRLGEDATFERMAEIVQAMVRDVMDAFVAGDVAAARAVIGRDDEVDALYHDTSRRLIAQMAADARLVETGIHLQAVAKFLERIGDHATNLGEQVIFMARGDDVRHSGARDREHPG